MWVGLLGVNSTKCPSRFHLPRRGPTSTQAHNAAVPPVNIPHISTYVLRTCINMVGTRMCGGMEECAID